MNFLILFTKDRPWQCSEYLRTFQKYCENIETVHAKIIWRSSDPSFFDRYVLLFMRLSMAHKFASIEFINQNEASFQESLKTATKQICFSDSVTFGCDDVLFYNKFMAAAPRHCILSHRLGTNINYCQPAQKQQLLPNLATMNKYFMVDANNLKHSSSFLDFAYPFELSASTYCWDEISFIENLENIKTPNFLEEQMHLRFLNLYMPTNLLFKDRPSASVITINRVQEDFKNPLAGTEKTLDYCNELFDSSAEYDDESYAKRSFNSIHVADFILKPEVSWN